MYRALSNLQYSAVQKIPYFQMMQNGDHQVHENPLLCPTPSQFTSQQPISKVSIILSTKSRFYYKLLQSKFCILFHWYRISYSSHYSSLNQYNNTRWRVKQLKFRLRSGYFTSLGPNILVSISSKYPNLFLIVVHCCFLFISHISLLSVKKQLFIYRVGYVQHCTCSASTKYLII